MSAHRTSDQRRNPGRRDSGRSHRGRRDTGPRSGDTLTERYVREVVRHLPADQREDVADELRTTIADTVEARAAVDPPTAEREVLTEMGDPLRLAARYTDRPLALIGPTLFPAYVRLLKLLLTTVLPVVTAVLVVLDVFEHNDLGSAIGAGVGAVLTVGAQMIAWVTVVFALIERAQGPNARRGVHLGVGDLGIGWTPDDLPELRDPDAGRVGAVAAAVWNVLLALLIVWQHTAEPARPGADAERMEVLDPVLWSGWIWPILAGLVGAAALELLRVRARRWTYPLAGAYAVTEAAVCLPLAWLLYDRRLLNPELVAELGGAERTWDAIYLVAALAVIAVGVTEVFNRFREAHRETPSSTSR